MGSYNVLRETTKRNNLPDNSVTTFLTGAIAGIITVYSTQPFDTIKTRAQGTNKVGTVEAIREVFHSSGLRGFWSGSTMRLGRLVLSGGIVFTVYEKVVDIFMPATMPL
jgi:solute carrier family 25 (mitochondrial citrate transporter), member 1